MFRAGGPITWGTNARGSRLDGQRMLELRVNAPLRIGNIEEVDEMGVLAWAILLLWSAAIATAAQYAFFRRDRGSRDYDWVFIAGGAVIGGFTAHVWYPGFGPIADGLWVIQALSGGLAGALVVELIYRLFIRPRQLGGRA